MMRVLVAGFLVSDLKTAVAELQAAGVEIVLPVQHGETRSWMHFRAPDGFVYELVEDSSAGGEMLRQIGTR